MLITQKHYQTITKYNNFDLIRLFAASQVMISHVASHLNIELLYLRFISFFPGVPIFFFISGYLIYESYERLEGIKEKYKIFYINRVLRIYPALYFCFFITLATIFFSGYFELHSPKLSEFLIWSGAQLTFFQFYNPNFFRNYGVGVVNGSLWTIAVELQFYLLTPLIYYLFKTRKTLLLIIFLVLMGLNFANAQLNTWTTLFEKLVGVSFVPWLYMFMLGAYVQQNKKLQDLIIRVNVLWYLTIYLIMYYLSERYALGSGNGLNVLSFVALSFLVFKLAYTKPTLSAVLLKNNDISYGIYIYHMPLVNLLLFFNLTESVIWFLLAIAGTLISAVLSWYLLERPCLSLKSLLKSRYIAGQPVK
jgi:peptidoglycan/LPS O-acetylase OafA/YrhL